MKRKKCLSDCEKCRTPGHRAYRNFLGEAVGTFFVLFFGMGAVANATLFGSFAGSFQVSLVWGFAIAIAIYMMRNLSDAHFNPAITVAMIATRRMPASAFWIYLLGQLAGAVAAFLLLWFFYADSIQLSILIEGTDFSEISAASTLFIQQYGMSEGAAVEWWLAALLELFGVMAVVFVVFSLTDTSNIGRPNTDMAPLLIGFTIVVISCMVGPLTNGSFNPVKDLTARVVGMLAGFDTGMVFGPQLFLIYVLAPIAGAVLGGLLFTRFIQPEQECGKYILDGECPEEQKQEKLAARVREMEFDSERVITPEEWDAAHPTSGSQDDASAAIEADSPPKENK